MDKNYLKITILLAVALLLFSNCETKSEEQTTNGAVLLGLVDSQSKAEAARIAATKVCETTIDSTYTSGSYAVICTPSAGVGRFFRITGVKTNGDNGYLYLFLGYASTPTSVTPNATGQYQFVFGKSVTNANPFAWFRNLEYGNYQAGQTASGANPSLSLTTEKEICVSFSGTSSAPRVNFWITGTNGADCQVRSSLTQTSSIIDYIGWSNASNVISSTSIANHFRFSSTALLTATKIFVSTESIF
ncbi:MAG: hypothetical protein SH817_18755 [Leptospira sp.]|nr:hypothetical protein [Leptospira sp.]